MSRDSSLGIPFDKFFSICGNYDSVIYGRALTLQLPFLQVSESMGNHDSKIVDAASVD